MSDASDLRAAAERLREHRAAVDLAVADGADRHTLFGWHLLPGKSPYLTPYPSNPNYPGVAWDQFRDDQALVVGAYLADRPADDAEPITGERLAALGYAVTADGGYGEMRHGDVTLRVCRFAANGWQFLAVGPPGTLQWAVSVMGDVRAMLRGLKVPAREHDPSLLANNRVLRADIAPNTDDEF